MGGKEESKMFITYLIYLMLQSTEVTVEATKITVETVAKAQQDMAKQFIPFVDDRYMAKQFNPDWK